MKICHLSNENIFCRILLLFGNHILLSFKNSYIIRIGCKAGSNLQKQSHRLVARQDRRAIQQGCFPRGTASKLSNQNATISIRVGGIKGRNFPIQVLILFNVVGRFVWRSLFFFNHVLSCENQETEGSTTFSLLENPKPLYGSN